MIMKEKSNENLIKIHNKLVEHLPLLDGTSLTQTPIFFSNITQEVLISSILNFDNINICNDRKCNLKSIKHKGKIEEQFGGASKVENLSPLNSLIQMVQKSNNFL